MTVTVEMTELQYIDPQVNSYKYYRVYLIGWAVQTQYGRIGTYGVFTPRKNWTNDPMARKEYEKTIHKKMAKGYELFTTGSMSFASDPSEHGLDVWACSVPKGVAPSAPAPATPPTPVSVQTPVDPTILPKVRAALDSIADSTSVPTVVNRPMLAITCDEDDVDAYIEDEDWVAQVKLDGERLLIVVDGGEVFVYNRQGQPKVKNVSGTMLAPFHDLTDGTWVFDGEIVGRTLWLFDMPVADIYHGPGEPFWDRYMDLVYTLKTMDCINGDVGLVRTATDTEDKERLFKETKDNGGEGIIFRDRLGAYQPAKRSANLQKYKFINEADCIVTAVGVGGKESVQLSVFKDDGTMIEVGSASTIGKSPDPQIGDVWETRFLYVTSADNPRMVQPRLSRVRTDKAPNECNIIQFMHCVTNKEVQQSNE